MIGYVVSLAMGLAVGVVYGLVHLRSPAPPLLALVGLLGMLLGEQAVGAARRHWAPPPPRTVQAGEHAAPLPAGGKPGPTS